MSGKAMTSACGCMHACMCACVCESLFHPVSLDVWVSSLITSVRTMSHLGECTCCSGQWALWKDSLHPQKVFTIYLFSLSIPLPSSNPYTFHLRLISISSWFIHPE